MFTNRVSRTLVLLFMLSANSAHAFFDPPYINPPNPIAGQPITFSIRGGVCDAIIGWPGFPIYSQIGNSIHITYFGAHVTNIEQCIFGIGTGTFPVGTFDAGDYALTLDLDYYGPFGEPSTLLLGVIPFTVAVAPPIQGAIPTPTLNMIGCIALVLILIGMTIRRFRSPPASLLILVALSCTTIAARAQVPAPPNLTIQITLTTAPGAPTPAQVVTYYNTTPRVGPPPLRAFTVKSPQTVQYLIPDRATGDFLTWLGNNPNSWRAKLENKIIGSFLTTSDVAAALTALSRVLKNPSI